MTHKDIYTKFMIEYDKANVTSSYPSLTEYEVATVLDKAYNALIAQKVTGNNVRRSTFESDIKSIADLGPLVISQDIALDNEYAPAPNSTVANLPKDLLYFLLATMWDTQLNKQYTPYDGQFNPADNATSRLVPVKLIDHNTAAKFFSSSYNMPWIKEPVCYIENNKVYFVYDPLNKPDVTSSNAQATVVYIKHPKTFVKDLSNPAISSDGYASYFDFNAGTGTIPSGSYTVTASDYNFECNSTVAEELISLAVAFALENVESQRLNSKLNMRGLEA